MFTGPSAPRCPAPHRRQTHSDADAARRERGSLTPHPTPRSRQSLVSSGMSSEEGRQRASGPSFLGWGGRQHGCGLSSPQDPQASPPSSSRTVRSSPVFVSYEGSGRKHLLQSSGEPSWGKAWGPRVTGQHGARASGAAPAAFPQRPRPGLFLEVTFSDVFPLAPGCLFLVFEAPPYILEVGLTDGRCDFRILSPVLGLSLILPTASQTEGLNFSSLKDRALGGVSKNSSLNPRPQSLPPTLSSKGFSFRRPTWA